MARATRADVARVAGVSVATVSHVMNGRAQELGFSPATARKVRQAAAEVGYVPRAAARTFRYQAGKVIALFYPDLPLPMRLPALNELLTSAIEAAGSEGYFILPVPIGDDPRSTVEKTLRDIELAGAMCRAHPDMGPAADLLHKADIPVAWLSLSRDTHEGPGCAHFGIDEVCGMRSMLDLIDCDSVERPCVVVGPGAVRDRQTAFLDQFPQARIFHAPGWSTSDAMGVGEAILDSEADLIFAANDYLALGVLCDMKRRGLVPGAHVQLFGFGDTDSGPARLVDMSSIQWPVAQLGYQAAIAVIDAIGGAQETSYMTLATHAHPRSTTRLAPAASAHTQV